jgi:hypothetical protein
MNKDVKIVHNVLQCVLRNSSRCHYLEPLRKGVIAKMAYLVEFCLILESELVECALQEIFVVWILKLYTKYYKMYSKKHIWSYCICIGYEEFVTLLPETPVLDYF